MNDTVLDELNCNIKLLRKDLIWQLGFQEWSNFDLKHFLETVEQFEINIKAFQSELSNEI